jgi:hypothetical protein
MIVFISIPGMDSEKMRELSETEIIWSIMS